MLPSRKKATDAGATGPKYYAKDGAGGRAKNNLARYFNIIVTKSVDVPKPYMANIALGQGAGHAPREVDYPFCVAT